MANKNVEGLWIVTAVHESTWGGETQEYKTTPRMVTTKAGLKSSVSAAWTGFGVKRVEVEEYTVTDFKTYEAEDPRK